ncbi:hypothetical protein BDV26DRAFT_258716 [Aspergillus bertholletiae]|uniref:Uncharacterized protein n=1 Tax=Aspergillus bertholletiae TaxID=1226010 RepID=A0A5N7BDB3_9EURO|nr:hypothetical protein BDV26DRAFT_258716 [Aspergillus bertholletiae]
MDGRSFFLGPTSLAATSRLLSITQWRSCASSPFDNRFTAKFFGRPSCRSTSERWYDCSLEAEEFISAETRGTRWNPSLVV